jgi:hypothetical protein
MADERSPRLCRGRGPADTLVTNITDTQAPC